MLGERVPAARAAEWGLINRAVADGEFEGHVRELTERLAHGPTRSFAGTKRQLNNRVYAGMAQQLELEADIQQEMAGSGDFVRSKETSPRSNAPTASSSSSRSSART